MKLDIFFHIILKKMIMYLDNSAPADDYVPRENYVPA